MKTPIEQSKQGKIDECRHYSCRFLEAKRSQKKNRDSIVEAFAIAKATA
jgi:hypothetical protein